MTKKQLLELLKQVDDEAIVYIETDEGIYQIIGVTDIVTGDDVQNEITLVCQ